MTIINAAFLPLVESQYGRYARYILGFRHFGALYDGFKPVQRRSVWALHEYLKATSRAHAVKTSRAAGDILGRLHPHETGSIVGALTGMSQAESNTPLVVGIGNWGSWQDPPSAERYTDCYLSAFAASFLSPDELTQVPFVPSYDGGSNEPLFLPAKVPNLLLSGCWSIATGASGIIPPCDPAWVLDAMVKIAEGKQSAIRSPQSFNYRWGGKLLSLEPEWLQTGAGLARFRPTMRLDVPGKAVVITSLAPNFNMTSLETYLEKQVPSFGGIVGGEPAQGDLLSVRVLLKRGHDLKDLARAIGQRAISRVSYSFLYIDPYIEDEEVRYTPKVAGPLEYLKAWVAWRTKVVVGAAKYRIGLLEADSARHALMIRVIDHRLQLVEALKSAKNADDLRRRVKGILRCTDEEVTVVLQVQLQRLASLEIPALRAKIDENNKQVANNQSIIRRPQARMVADAEAAVGAIATTAEEVKQHCEVRRSKRARSP